MEDQHIIVHKRVLQRHPNLAEEDVLAAWSNRIKCQARIGPWPPQYVAVGFDSNGRSVEMVAVYDPQADEVLIFHAQSPATKNVRRELGMDD